MSFQGGDALVALILSQSPRIGAIIRITGSKLSKIKAIYKPFSADPPQKKHPGIFWELFEPSDF
jgi:hypothetical protein